MRENHMGDKRIHVTEPQQQSLQGLDDNDKFSELLEAFGGDKFHKLIKDKLDKANAKKD